MAALHLLATQSTQLPRASTAVASPSSSSRPPLAPPPPPVPTYAGLSAPIYPYARETPHPLLRGALRRGKWTPEEEAYAAATIQYFLSGVLPIQYGATLRGYIAQLLHCDPMRVSKKLIPGSIFVGVRIDPKIGRRSYYPCPVDMPGLDVLKEQAERHMAQLRAAFIESIEREEAHEQAAINPQPQVLRRAPPGPSERPAAPSPLKRKRSEHDDDAEAMKQAPPPPHGRFPQTRAPSLPSLTALLWQTRQHAEQPDALAQHAYPPPAAWPQAEAAGEHARHAFAMPRPDSSQSQPLRAFRSALDPFPPRSFSQ